MLWQKIVENMDLEKTERIDFDSIFGIDQLDLNYEAHVAGFDGESFL